MTATALQVLTSGSHHSGHFWWPLWLLPWAALIGIGIWLILSRRDRRTGRDESQRPPTEASSGG